MLSKKKDSRICDFSWQHEKGLDASAEVEYYDKVWGNAGWLFKRYAKQALRLKPDAQEIVDIGTGPGYMAICLAKISSKKVKAIDSSLNMLKKASERSKRVCVDLDLIEGKCEAVPLQDNSVDLLTANNLIHCLSDPLRFLIEIKRVMKDGGRVMLKDYRRDTWKLIRKLADFHSRVVFKNKPLGGMGEVLDASFIKEELIDLFKRAGIDNHQIKQGILNQTVILRF